MVTTPDHLNTAAAAAALGVSVDTIRHLIRTGKLPAVRRGTANRSGYLIARADLERYIASLPPATREDQQP